MMNSSVFIRHWQAKNPAGPCGPGPGEMRACGVLWPSLRWFQAHVAIMSMIYKLILLAIRHVPQAKHSGQFAFLRKFQVSFFARKLCKSYARPRRWRSCGSCAIKTLLRLARCLCWRLEANDACATRPELEAILSTFR